jgi:hypothetical protein
MLKPLMRVITGTHNTGCYTRPALSHRLTATAFVTCRCRAPSTGKVTARTPPLPCYPLCVMHRVGAPFSPCFPLRFSSKPPSAPQSSSIYARARPLKRSPTGHPPSTFSTCPRRPPGAHWFSSKLLPPSPPPSVHHHSTTPPHPRP